MEQDNSSNIHSINRYISRRSLAALMVFGVLILIALFIIIFSLPKIFAEMIYPLAYESIVTTQAQEHDLDPFLVAAVIHAESRFNPNATSSAGARGLMQLMPATALGIANRMGDNSFTIAKLYDPTTNIEYGTFHLQGLMGRYNSNVEAALAAYNGGGAVGDRYIRGDRTTIPLESLRYVKKVVTAKEQYQKLYPTRLSSFEEIIGVSGEPRETFVSKILELIRFSVKERLTGE